MTDLSPLNIETAIRIKIQNIPGLSSSTSPDRLLYSKTAAQLLEYRFRLFINRAQIKGFLFPQHENISS